MMLLKLFIFFVFIQQTKQHLLENYTTVCGRSTETYFRIIGGTRVVFNEHPWIVALVNEGKPQCGGVLITPQHVLTAAHCFRTVQMSPTDESIKVIENNFTFLFGISDLTQSGLLVPMKDVVIHEGYNLTVEKGYKYGNDIAIVELEHSVNFTPICIPDNVDLIQLMLDTHDYYVTALGWGKIESTAESVLTSQYLLKADLSLVRSGVCKKSRRQQMTLKHKDRMFCTDAHGRDTCRGDSGGPLVKMIDGLYYTVGIVSFGSTTCGVSHQPSINTNVFYYKDWILNTLKNMSST